MNSGALRTTVLVLAIVATLGAFGWYLLGAGGSDDRATPPPAAPSPTPEVLTAEPADEGPAPTTPTPTPTSEPTPEPTAAVECEDETTRFNADGTQGDSLLPDCGQAPVTKQQQHDDGLSLACGGDYPVILYKSTTSAAKTSICGRDAVGDRFRVVIKPDGESTLDLDGSYDWRQDAYVAKNEGVRYELHAVDGSLHVTRNGSTKVQQSSDWISLDNETDDL